LDWDDSLIWYQGLNDQAVTSLNLIISIYLIKIKQNNVDLCKFQAQKAFSWESVLENNINNILKPYLIA
jgi:hypothetical protein